MNNIENATIYLTKPPKDLAKIMKNGKTDGGLLRNPTYVEYPIGGQIVRLNLMPKEDLPGHLAGFAGYMKHLKDQRINSEAQIRTATAVLPNIVAVLGVVVSKPFDLNSEVTSTLFAIAQYYEGYVFILNSLISYKLETLCGPAQMSRQ